MDMWTFKLMGVPKINNTSAEQLRRKKKGATHLFLSSSLCFMAVFLVHLRCIFSRFAWIFDKVRDAPNNWVRNHRAKIKGFLPSRSEGLSLLQQKNSVLIVLLTNFHTFHIWELQKKSSSLQDTSKLPTKWFKTPVSRCSERSYSWRIQLGSGIHNGLAVVPIVERAITAKLWRLLCCCSCSINVTSRSIDQYVTNCVWHLLQGLGEDKFLMGQMLEAIVLAICVRRTDIWKSSIWGRMDRSLQNLLSGCDGSRPPERNQDVWIRHVPVSNHRGPGTGLQ